jgi:hypothetical protein
MIQGEIKQDLVPYRQKDGLNFSSIKTFADKGVGVFYKEYILGEKKDYESNALAIGNMIDDIILTYAGDVELFHQHFEEKYAMSDVVKSSAQAFVLADVLFDSMMETAKDGVITADFEYTFKEAFDKVQAMGKYKGKVVADGLVDFNKVAKSYYDKKISSVGKIMVDLKTLTIAEEVSARLLTDNFTAGVFKSEKAALIPKVVVEFEYMGLKCKSELDGVQINHEEKTINGVDLKSTYDNESFDYMYVRNKYYLQQAFYTIALKSWMIAEGLDDYTVLPFKFIVADTSANKRRPLIYQLNSVDLTNGMNGFTINNSNYVGLITLIKDIKWHIDMDVWNCGKEAYENNGVVNLSINYGE